MFNMFNIDVKFRMPGKHSRYSRSRLRSEPRICPLVRSRDLPATSARPVFPVVRDVVLDGLCAPPVENGLERLLLDLVHGLAALPCFGLDQGVDLRLDALA